MKNPEYVVLRREVEERENVYTVEMRRLREIHGADRLGKHIRESISESLASHGLAHFPVELPDRQDALVRVYKQGSPVESLMKSVLNVSLSADIKLRHAVSSRDAERIREIREILDDE